MRVRKACCDSRYSKRESAYCTITRAVYNTLQFLSVWFDTAPPDAATPNLRGPGRMMEVRSSSSSTRCIPRVAASHSSQGQTADRGPIHTESEKSELLVNDRFACVSVSRGQYDAQIYTNDRGGLAPNLNRDNSQHTATGTPEQQPSVPTIEPVPARSGHRAERNEATV
jgi:hypothetical protein